MDRDDDCRDAVAALAKAGRLALDIEADSLYHYFEKVCLIQISTDEETFLLDPLALPDLEGLGPVFSDSRVEKVLHAASYDLFSLHRDYGFSFSNIFDTHIAAQFLGHTQLGLDSLLEQVLGVSHSKRRQRDDWSRRPLEQAQLEYAATDTHHLLPLRDELERRLKAEGRIEWAREEFQAAEEPPQEKPFDPEGFRKIKGSRDLSPQELAILRALYLLRDRYARQLDVPPFKVLNNPVLIDLARRPPESKRDLVARRGVSFRVARYFGEELFQAIHKAAREDPSFLARPPRTEWVPFPREARERLERLKQWRLSKAEALSLSVGVLFPGNLLEALAVRPVDSVEAMAGMDGMRRWRIREFGDEILQLLSTGSNT